MKLIPDGCSFVKVASGFPKPASPMIEPLEARIAPAAIATFIDVDGDTVKVVSSKGNNMDLQTIVQGHEVFNGTGYQVQELDLTDVVPAKNGEFDGTSLSIAVVKKSAGGDGLVNIGWINAPGLNLGSVTIKGDLGRIDVGSGSVKTRALNSLNVTTLGGQGIVTQASGSNLESDIDGSLGALNVSGDVIGAYVNVVGGKGILGAVNIGALVGQNASNSGVIYGAEGIGPVKIARNLAGGGAGTMDTDSGYVSSGGKIASIFIGGDVVGGSGHYSGAVYAEEGMGPVTVKGHLYGGMGSYSGAILTSGAAAIPMGPVTIGKGIISEQATTTDHTAYISAGKLLGITVHGDVEGGDGTDDGSIQSTGKMGNVFIGGDVSGNGGKLCGYIASGTTMGNVTIMGNLIGGSESTDSSVGTIFSAGDMGAVFIKKDIIGGVGMQDGLVDSHGKLAGVTVGNDVVGGGGTDSGEIYSAVALGPIKVGMDVIGSSVGTGPFNGYIGSLGPISSVTVGNDLLGGINNDSGEINASGNIGAVKIGKDMIGVAYTGSGTLLRSATIDVGGKLGSLTVGGSLFGGDVTGTGSTVDSSAIRAGQIGSISVHGNIEGQLDANTPYNFEIAAVDQTGHGAHSDTAIGSIHVKGDVKYMDILAGYAGLTASQAEAGIGSVTVGGAWVASNLVAGVKNPAMYFGDGNDALITAAPAILPKIGSIVIGKTITGLGNAGDHYGFVAGQIGSFKADGLVQHLKPGPGNDDIALDATGTNDVSIHEVS